MISMTKVSNFLRTNEFAIGLVLKIVFPLVVVSALFYLDQRYVKMEAYERTAVEQRESLKEMANAISRLADQQNLFNATMRENLVTNRELVLRFDRHEGAQQKALEALESRIARLESSKLGK